MKTGLYFLMGVLLFSCGGAPTKKKTYKDVDKYKPKVSKVYRRANDRFAFGAGEKDALIAESLNRVRSKIAGKAAGDDDPISQIIGKCYEKDYDDAFEVADEHYESYKKNPSYWNQIGTCYLLKGEEKKASVFYNKARGLNKTFFPAINNFGVIYLNRGKDQLALNQFKKASRISPQALTPKFNQANIYLKNGLHQKACPIFRSIDKRSPGDPDVVNALAVCSLLNGRYKTAVAIYKNMDGDFKERPYIGLNYALALKLSGKREDAQDALDDVDTGKLGSLKKYHQSVKNYIAGGRR